MALRLLYRSYGGENRKHRPSWYSKTLCLQSFLRAAERSGAEVVFLNDGPIPEDRLQLMRAAGPLVELPGVGMRRSYLAGLRFAASGRWPEDDVVWFSEDDYLYLPEAFTALDRAVGALPDADYFALYASTPSRVAQRYAPTAHQRPPGWRDLPPVDVDGQEWVQVQSTASTFGARVGALAQDLGIFRLCMTPHRNMYRDHDTCAVYQGFRPYPWGTVARHALGLTPGPATARLRGAALAPFEAVTNLRAHRRPARRRQLLAADPNLAAHVEDDLLSPGTDWAAVAADTLRWSREAGHPDYSMDQAAR